MAWSFDGGDWARVTNGRIEFKNADGSWSAWWQVPEHAESLSYVQRAVDDPQVDQLIAYQRAGGSLNAEQSAFFANPLVGLDSFGQGYRWGAINLFDNAFSPQQAGAVMQFGVPATLTAADVSAGKQFNFDQSPAEQAKRSGGDGFLGMGSMFDAVALAAAAYFGGGALGLWGGEAVAAGVDASALASADLVAADSMAGLIPGSQVSAWSGAGSGFLETAKAVAQGAQAVASTAKSAASLMQIANPATGQRSLVPTNAPVPAGWRIDPTWTPPAEKATATMRGLPMQNLEPTIMPASSGPAVPLLAFAALAGAVFYLVK